MEYPAVLHAAQYHYKPVLPVSGAKVKEPSLFFFLFPPFFPPLYPNFGSFLPLLPYFFYSFLIFAMFFCHRALCPPFPPPSYTTDATWYDDFAHCNTLSPSQKPRIVTIIHCIKQVCFEIRVEPQPSIVYPVYTYTLSMFNCEYIISVSRPIHRSLTTGTHIHNLGSRSTQRTMLTKMCNNFTVLYYLGQITMEGT